ACVPALVRGGVAVEAAHLHLAAVQAVGERDRLLRRVALVDSGQVDAHAPRVEDSAGPEHDGDQDRAVDREGRPHSWRDGALALPLDSLTLAVAAGAAAGVASGTLAPTSSVCR